MQTAILIETCRGARGESRPYALLAPEGLADRLRTAAVPGKPPAFSMENGAPKACPVNVLFTDGEAAGLLRVAS